MYVREGKEGENHTSLRLFTMLSLHLTHPCPHFNALQTTQYKVGGSGDGSAAAGSSAAGVSGASSSTSSSRLMAGTASSSSRFGRPGK